MSSAARHGNSLTSHVIKAISIFSSIEMLSILCAIVRTKLVALWIGATGVGVITLYNSTLEMLRAAIQLNVRQSAVREIASSSAEERELICHSTNRLGIYIGVISSIIVAILSPILSLTAFGSYDYTWGFGVLALTMFASAVSDTRRAILQGTDMLRQLAQVSVSAAVISTIAAIPLFYWFRMQAIVPVILIFSFSTMGCMMLPRVPLTHPTPPSKALHQAMGKILRLGTFLTIATATTLIADYVLRIYLSSSESIATVGRYQAGYTVVNTYVGVIFTAIAVEYFPRLSAIIRHNYRSEIIVTHEITVVTWILLPVVVLFICADELIIKLLYSSEFMAIIPYISIAIIGTLLRGASWCIAYVIIAKGDGKAYIITEALSATTTLALSIIGWELWGYVGIGIAYVAIYLIYTLVTCLVVRYRYGISIAARVSRLLAIAITIAIAALIAKSMVGWWLPVVTILPWLLPLSIKHLRR